MKDLNLNIPISIINNTWKGFVEVKNSLTNITQTTLNFTNKLAEASSKFVVINEIATTLKEKLWWIFWNAIDEADKLNTAMVGLKSIVEWTWNDFKQAEKFIQDFTKDWLVWTTEAAASLKNLLASWYGLDEARILMERLKDSAAFGRASHLQLWEAIQTATDWIKNQNSVLVDNAWVSKNLSVIWDEYAKSIWKSAKNLTDAERRQATLNWIIEETKFQVWDASKLAEQYSWQKLKLTQTISTLSATIGSKLLPTLSEMMAYVTPLVQWIIDWSTANPWLAKTITILLWGFTWLLIAFTWIAAILPLISWAFTILTWPIWIVIWLIAAFALAYQTNFLWIADLTNYIFSKISEFFSYFSETLWSLAWIVFDYFERIKWPFLEFSEIILPHLQWFFDIFANLFSSTFDNIILLITGAWNIIQGIFQIAFGLITGIFEIFINIFTWNWEDLWIAVLNLVTNFLEWLKNIFNWTIQVLYAIVSEGLEILKWIFSAAWEAIKLICKVAWEWILWVLKIVWEAIKTIATWVFEGIKSIISWVWENIKNKALEIWDSLKTWLSDIWNWILNSATSIFTWIADSITGIFQGAVDFVKSAWEEIKRLWNWITWASDDINKKNNSINTIATAKSIGSASLTGWRAYWWNVGVWKAYIVWERWPEMFIPAQNGTIIPNNSIGWAIVNINMWWVVVKTEADEIRLIEKMKTELTRTLQLNKRGIL